jgi:uridine kinase
VSAQSRADILQEVATYLLRQPATYPLRVAIDGRTASGKTRFADDLSGAVRGLDAGREVIRTSIDGFHNPRAVRYARGRHSPEGYYRDARNLMAVTDCLLAPLSPSGSRVYRTEVWDLAGDSASAAPEMTASPDAILIVDGTFLARPELAGYWDVHIFLDVSAETCLERGRERDMAAGADRGTAEAAYRDRYLPAFALYETEAGPLDTADFLILMERFDAPEIRRRPPP